MNEASLPDTTGVERAAAVMFTGARQDVRELLTEHLGQVLTPELAASIELAARQPSFNDRLTALQLEAETVPQVDCPVKHHFAPGIYAREMSIPAGTMVVGATHLQENLVIVKQGEILAATPSGVVTVTAGQVMRCMPGTKNAVIAVTDASWMNVFSNPDDETDINVLTTRYVGVSSDKLLGGFDNQQLLNAGAAVFERLTS